ncbi:hypothetical protein [Alsobacter soli]|uniref:hypothetical protein n=1 Tax=Alsobacter soli TaxID=2109933 RepID=UPI0011B25EA4|nr:hypothetical protein [Alsobacter soli]
MASRLLAQCAAVALLVASHPALAAKSTLRAMEMNGYGRAIFSFDDLPKASARVMNGILLITFDRQVDFPVDKLTQELPSYVSAVRLDPDGKTMRMALQKPVRPNMMEAGDKLFVDLLPESWKGMPPSLPQEVIDELTRRAKEAEETARRLARKRASEETRNLTFRVGTTPTFSRLVFELPGLTPVDMAKDGARVELSFEGNLKVDAARLKAALPALMPEVEAEAAPGRLRLTLTAAPGVDVRGFREDESYVLDFAPPKPVGKPGKTAASPSPEAGPKPDKPAKAAAAEAPAPAPTVAKPVIAPVPAFVRPADADERALAAAPAEQAAIKLGVSTDRGSVRLAIPLPPETGLAVFERAGIVWIAAESAAPFDPAQIGLSAPGLVTKVDVRRVGRLSILRLSLAKPALVRAAAADRQWVVTLGDELIAPSDVISFGRGAAPDGRTVVRAAFPDLSSVHWVEDPEAGDKLAIVTGRRSARGVVKAQGFVDFQVLPSAQGVVVVPTSDDVAVRAGVDDVSVTRDGGLVVSALPELPLAAAPGQAPRLVVDADTWARARAGVVREQLRALERAAADAPRNARAEARLALARLQFAAGLAPEALGAIEVALADAPDTATDRSTLVLKGAALTIAGRLAEANKLLGADALANEPEALLWRAYGDALERRWPQALAQYRRAARVLPAYPEGLQARLLPAFAEAALEQRDYGLAQRLLDQVDGRDADKGDRDYALLVGARVAEGLGRVDEALQTYKKLAGTAVRPVEAAARLYGALLALKDHSIERTTAIGDLEVLSVSWRGDETEVKTLATLGRLYAEDERWRDAFRTARQASTLFPDDDATRSLYDEAASRFEQLFLEGKADAIPRIDALALYFDFKEFTPPGRRGDEMIRRLAERLVSLDLLGEAADLLQYQVDNRLNGAAKAGVATRLAVLYLMNRQPAKAYKALMDSRLAELPQELKRGRSLLEARALSDLSRTDLALEMIDAESGPDVERLRADVLWQGRRWREAGEVFERMVGDRWQGPEPLDDAARADVMRAAIAYGLGDENLALERLRAKFATKMADSADAKAFMLVTLPSAQLSPAYREVARSVASSDTLSEFLGEYRKRYPDTPALPPRPAKAGKQPAPKPPESPQDAPQADKGGAPAEPKKAEAEHAGPGKA